MPQDHFARFFCLFAAGLGLVLAGGINIAFRSGGGLVRVLVCVVAVGCAAAGIFLLTDNPTLTVQAAGLMGVVVAPCLLAGSPRVVGVISAALGLLRLPRVRWGVLTTAGLAIVIGSAVAFEADDQAVIDQQMVELDDLSAVPQTQVSTRGRAATDRGTAVVLKDADPRPDYQAATVEERYLQRNKAIRDRVIRQSPADDRTNCHGWVFTGGQYWVGGTEVVTILAENQYQPVTDPQPGDLVVYRDDQDAVTHTALVRYVTPGLPVLVEGKWGSAGVFLHPVDHSCYGTRFGYYRSGRSGGHLLAGLGASSGDPLRNQPAE